MKKSIFWYTFVVITLVIICIMSVACTTPKDTDGNAINYEDIQSVTVDQNSIESGFLIDEFDISKVILLITYKETSTTGKAMKEEQDKRSKEAGTSVATYNYTVKKNASEDMVRAEDKEKLGMEGTNSITLLYGKFTITFLLTLYSSQGTVMHKVRFFAEDGVTQLGETQYIIDGGRATQPAYNMKKGYVFSGWKNLTTDKLDALDNITSDTDFVAYYLSDAFTVKYVVRYRYVVDGEIVLAESRSNTEAEYVIAETDVPRGESGKSYYPEVPSITGYTFSGWQTFSSELYYAIFDKDTYAITFVYRPYNKVTGSYSDNFVFDIKEYYPDDLTIEEPQDAYCDGVSSANDYQFINWYYLHQGRKIRIEFPLTDVVSETTIYANYVDMNRGSEDLEYKIISEEEKTCVVSSYNGSDIAIVIPRLYTQNNKEYTVIGLDDGVFKNCTVEKFVVSSENEYFTTINGVLYSKDKKVLYAYPVGNPQEEFVLDGLVEEISSYAFYRGSNLHKVYLPHSLLQIDDYAFSLCSSLRSVIIPELVRVISEGAFRMANDTLLTSITFEGTQITELGDEAFYGLKKLGRIDLPASINTIGDGTFYGCVSLQEITADNNSYFIVDHGALYDYEFKTLYLYPSAYSKNENPEFVVDERCRTIKRGAFYQPTLSCITFTSNISLETYSVVCPSLHSIRFTINNFDLDTDNFEQSFAGQIPKIIYVPENDTAFNDFSDATILKYQLSSWSGYENYTEDGFSYIYVDMDGTPNAQGDYVLLQGYRGTNTILTPSFQINGKIVIGIADYAFYQNTTIASFTVPVNMTFIGKYAFYGCTSLKTVVLSQTDASSLNSIGDYAFANCSQLTTVSYETSLKMKTFGRYVFDGTICLERTKFFTVAGVLVRYNGTESSVTLASDIRYIATDAFKDKGFITSISLEKCTNLFYVDAYAFQNCIGLTEISFPASIRYIADYAFYSCSYLFSVIYNAKESDVEIGYFAYAEAGTVYTDYRPIYERFSDTKVYTVSYGTDADKQEGIAFVASPKLNDHDGIFLGWFYDDKIYHNRVTYPMAVTADLTLYARFDESKYTSAGIKYDLNEDGTYSVSDYPTEPLEVDGQKIYYDTYVVIPSTYKNSRITGIKSGALGENIVDFSLPTTISQIEYNAFASTFWYKNFAGDFVIYNNILIGYKGTSNIVHIPDNITLIADGVFMNNQSITQVDLPSGITTIPKDLFNGCRNLKSISIGGSVANIEEGAFKNCINLTSVIFTEGGSLSSIADDSFEGTVWLSNQKADCLIINNIFYRYFGTSEVIHVPEGAISIAMSAFKDNKKLKTVYIPTSVTTIYEYAFENCTLSSIVLPKEGSGLRFIMDSAFENCINLSQFDFESLRSLSYIGKRAFYSCISLDKITLPGSANTIEKEAFAESSISGLEIIESSALQTIYDNAFKNCTSLESVVFKGTSVLSKIGSGVFYNCISLHTFDNQQANLSTIESQAFYNCVSLDAFYIKDSAIKDIGLDAFYNVGKNVFASDTDSNMLIVGNILLSYSGSAQKVTIPANIILIYNSAFEGNTHLISIEFSSKTNLKTINDRAFYGCTNLTEINFPSSITFVGDDVMTGTDWLLNKTRTDTYIYIGNTLIKYNPLSVQEAVIPSNVTVINKNAFSGTSVYNIYIGSQVTLIKEGAFDGIVSAKWEEKSQILLGYTLTMESITPPTFEEKNLLSTLGCKYVFVQTEDAVDNYRLAENWKEQYESGVDFIRIINYYEITYSIVDGEADTIDGEQIHALYSAKDVVAYESSKKKYEFVGWFLDAYFEQAVTYPLVLSENTTIYAKCIDYSIGSNPGKFSLEETSDNMYTIKSYHDTVDKKVVIITEQSSMKIKSITGYIGYVETNSRYELSSDTTETLYVLDGTYRLYDEENDYGMETYKKIQLYQKDSDGDFVEYNGSDSNIKTYKRNTVIEEIAFANNCTIEEFGDYCFAGLTSLKKITLPSSLKRISSNAFADCVSLEEVVFDVECKDVVIFSKAFRNCTSLRSITFPSGIKDIQQNAFEGCLNLVSIYMEAEQPIQLEYTCPFEFTDGLAIYVPNYQSYYSAWESYKNYIKEK